MGLYLRPSRFLKVRVTRRGVRWAIGPRWLRLHLGSGGPGLSTGAGPVSVYRACTGGALSAEAGRALCCPRNVRATGGVSAGQTTNGVRREDGQDDEPGTARAEDG